MEKYTRTEEELAVLYSKFDYDVKTKSQKMRILLAVDQMFNVLLWNGSQDETISSNVGRKMRAGTATWFDKLVCRVLNKVEYDHCKKSIGE